MTTNYSSPSVEVADIEVEGVLCASFDTEVGDGGNAFDEE
jgi:hypothetical protein